MIRFSVALILGSLSGSLYADANAFKSSPKRSTAAQFCGRSTSGGSFQDFVCDTRVNFNTFSGLQAQGNYTSPRCAGGPFTNLVLIAEPQRLVNGDATYQAQISRELRVAGDTIDRLTSDVEAALLNSGSCQDAALFAPTCSFVIRGFWGGSGSNPAGRVAYCVYQANGRYQFTGVFWRPSLDGLSLFTDFEFDGFWSGQF